MDVLSNSTMDTDAFMNLNRHIWDQLDHNIWPQELAPIKPSKWEHMDSNLKGKAVLENLGKIIYYVTVLTNESEQVRRQGFQAQHTPSDPGSKQDSEQRLGRVDHFLEPSTDSLLYSSHIYP